MLKLKYIKRSQKEKVINNAQSKSNKIPAVSG